jgi:hypothetical protein
MAALFPDRPARRLKPLSPGGLGINSGLASASRELMGSV